MNNEEIYHTTLQKILKTTKTKNGFSNSDQVISNIENLIQKIFRYTQPICWNCEGTGCLDCAPSFMTHTLSVTCSEFTPIAEEGWDEWCVRCDYHKSLHSNYKVEV